MPRKSKGEAPRWSAILEVRDPDGTRTRHPFRHPSMSIGRKRDNDLMLPDEAISSRHCEFASEQGFFLVRDLGSHNGTFVNGKRAHPQHGATLRDGDEVQIGETHIKVALQGQVKLPPLRLRFGWPHAAALVLLLAAIGGFFWRQRAQEQELRVRYSTDLREDLRRDPCTAAPFEEVNAIDQQIAGRSFAIGIAKGEVKIAPQDERDDRALLDLYRRKLAAYSRLESALTDSQQDERESQEKLSRLGVRLSAGRDRKLALWAEGVLRERQKAGEDLLQGIQGLHAQSAKLVSLVEAVVVRREVAMASSLAHFRFAADLPALREACAAQASRATAAATGAFSALDE